MGAAREADLARYDERGVVIPAPLQGSDAALAGRRYGDKHRGPAVADAYELWHCRIDLAERSERWPSPPNLPPRMVEMASNIPEDQRADWLRRQANLEEVDRRISYAIRSGDLPIWVAPQGEPDRLVATGALATIDKRSINGGVFCPLSEEHKSEADRPWLWERPLFVKWNDWVRFAPAVDAEMKLTISPDPLTPLLPPDGQFVSLSHALTWIAFGVSMDSDKLHEVLTFDRYGEHDPQEAIKAAVGQLVDLGRAERLAMQGKYRESHRDDKRMLLSAAIEPIKFADYKQFNYLRDELRQGNGLTWWRTAQGVTERLAGGGRLDSFIEVEVNRGDLLREFRPGTSHVSESDHFRVGHSFNRDDPANIAPWWSINQALAWVATRIPSYVEYIGNLETDEPREHRPYIVHAICESQVAESDEGKAFMQTRRAGWPEGTFLAHAGRDLLEKILAGGVRPMARQNGQGRQMRAEEFVGVGKRATGGDWLDLDPQPLFSSAEMIGTYPMSQIAPARPGKSISSTAGAESDCREWLIAAFGADPENKRAKSQFQADALSKFAGRLSRRGFLRAWDAVAPKAGRSKPGRKS